MTKNTAYEKYLPDPNYQAYFCLFAFGGLAK
jgi:hypothetical protein